MAVNNSTRPRPPSRRQQMPFITSSSLRMLHPLSPLVTFAITCGTLLPGKLSLCLQLNAVRRPRPGCVRPTPLITLKRCGLRAGGSIYSISTLGDGQTSLKPAPHTPHLPAVPNGSVADVNDRLNPAAVSRSPDAIAPPTFGELSHKAFSMARLPRVKTSKVPHQRRHSWHPWQCGSCNLQNLKGARETESLSLRQL
jgi:hypothetical protein